MWDSRRHVLSIVEQGHNASVETLHAASIVLQKCKTKCYCVMTYHHNTGSSLHEHTPKKCPVTKFCHWTQMWDSSPHLTFSSLTFLVCTQILLFYLLLSLSSSIFPSGYTHTHTHTHTYIYIYCFLSPNFTVLYVITTDNDRNKFNVSSKQ